MAPIDDKVVAMSFESGKFESGVDKTLSALDKLKASLKLPNAGKGFDDINKAAQNVQLSHIGEGVDNIKRKLETLKLVGIGVLTHLANLAVDTGMKFVRSFALGPLQAGFQEYSTNLNAVQTILANTQASGATLKDVNSALLDLNKYSDKTIYNFSQMAKNIGTFTAAGVDLSTSTQAIKGIANLAALSGSNADQASTAMYQLSQAISAGRVSLQDWNSVVNAGMGGTVFQRALAQTAEAMGTLKDGAVKLQGPMKNVSINGETFRESIGGPGPKWLTSDVLTTTLKQFTGDLSDAQLHAQGFNDAQIKAIQQTAKTAQHAATEVKTISQVIDVAKETAGSGWAQTWQIIFGNFGEAKTLFTGVSNAVNGFINASSQARNKVLGDWKALGGRTVLINSIKTAFHNLGEILKPIKEAFRDIFPPATGKDLYNLTLRFRDFANALKPSTETVDNLKRTFRGFFALLDIGKQIIGGIFTVFGQLFGAVGDGSGSFLSFTGNIGDFLVSVDKALRQGGKLHSFFVSLGTTLAAPIKLLGQLRDYLSNLFGGFSPGGFSDQRSEERR
jgi:tape measure domain-containing protein